METDVTRPRTPRRRTRPRSLLGSQLWLRPPPPREGMRWRSFAAREDLVRSDPPPLPAEGATGPGSPSCEILLAFDPWGAPAVLFALVTNGVARTEVRFAVPRDAGAAFREALHLLGDLLRRRGDARELWTRLPAGTPAVGAVLESCGWFPGGGGIWTLPGEASARRASEPSRAR